MADDAQRGVTFTLKANVDPSAKQTVDSWFSELNASINTLQANTQQAASAATQGAAASVAASAAQTTAAAAAAANQATEAVQSAADAISNSTQRIVEDEEESAEDILRAWTAAARKQVEVDMQAAAESVRIANQSSEEIAARLRQLEGEKAEIRRVSSDKERADYIHAQLALVDITRRRREAEDAMIEAKDRGDKKSTIVDLTNYAQQLAFEEVQVAQEVADKKLAFLDAEKRERAFLTDEEIKNLRRIQAERESAAAAAVRQNQQIGSSVSRVVSAFSEGSEALMRFVNGIQHLGLVGEKDLQKVQDAILRIQGTTQIFTGLIRIFRQASEGIDAYRRIVELTTAAQVASAAATTADTVATDANTVAHAANQAARNPTMPTTTRVVMGASRIGTGIANFAGGIGIGAVGAGGLTVATAAGAAFASSLFAAASAVNTFRESLTFGIGGGAKEGSMTQNLGTSSWNPFARMQTAGSASEAISVGVQGFLDPFNLFGFSKPTAGEQKQADEAKMEKARLEFRQRTLELQKEAEREIKDIETERNAIVARQHASEKEIHSARLQSLKPEERRAELIKEIHRAEHDNNLGAEDRGRKVIELQRQRLTVEKEINREQQQAAKEQLSNLEDQAKVKERELEKARTEAMSAAERFGLLGQEEQQTLIESRRKFQAGAGTVDVEELKKLRGFSGALDEQIAAEARRRAAAAGFGEFQGADMQRIKQLEAERRQIEVKVKAQADVVAKLDVDIEATAREINKQISVQWQSVLNSMATQIAELQGKQTDVENRLAKRFGRVPQ